MEDAMDVDGLIDAYVQDVAKQLPRKQRADVALELRELLREELQSRAASRGRSLDADIALEGLRAFGRPRDVAARYFEPWVVIPATETRRFVFAAIIGALVLMALSPLAEAPMRSNRVGTAILTWLGMLVVYFGLQSAWQRRKGAATAWTPRDHDRVNRAGSLALVVLIGVGLVAYGAPGWLFAQITSGGTLSSRFDYDPDFYSSRLPVLLVIWVCQAILFIVLALRGRWNFVLRRMDLGLETGVVFALIWFAAEGHVFVSTALNEGTLVGMSIIASLMLIEIGVKIYRANRIPRHDELRLKTN
jgi:hypothetical protein